MQSFVRNAQSPVCNCRIFLREIRFRCQIGIDPAEQQTPQRILADIEITPANANDFAANLPANSPVNSPADSPADSDSPSANAAAGSDNSAVDSNRSAKNAVSDSNNPANAAMNSPADSDSPSANAEAGSDNSALDSDNAAANVGENSSGGFDSSARNTAANFAAENVAADSSAGNVAFDSNLAADAAGNYDSSGENAAAENPVVDYAAVLRRLRVFAASKQHGLLETFAEEIADIILDEFAAKEVRVHCRKPEPFPDLAAAAVEIQKTRTTNKAK